MAAKPTEVVAVKVRMREKLRRSLLAEAKTEGHSLNKEIEKRLQRSLNQSTVFELIELAAQRAATAQTEFIMGRLNTVFALLGRPDLQLKVDEGDDTND
jgi:hypothetical protein